MLESFCNDEALLVQNPLCCFQRGGLVMADCRTVVALMLHGLVTMLCYSMSATSCIIAENPYFCYPLHCSTASPQWSPSVNGRSDSATGTTMGVGLAGVSKGYQMM